MPKLSEDQMYGRWGWVLCLCVVSVYAQVDGSKGSITGSVLDRSGEPIPAAKVLAIQTSSGLERETASDRNGQFHLPSLLPGEYELRVESGAVGAIVRDIVVRVGASVQINVSVALRSAPESVEVSASVLSVADADMTQVVPFEAIRDLPINGRRFQEFATLTPTALVAPETLGQLSFVGQRGVHSNVLVDGTDYNEPFLGGIRGGDRSGWAFTIPQSAIQEFQTVTSGYSAEYGRSTGGVINAITRSGANSYHGDAFYLFRNEALSRQNPLGQESLERQHQFGGSAGGPAVRDRLFFFGAAEQQFASFPRQVQFSALDGVTRTPEIAPAYDFFKTLEQPFDQTNDATAVLGRGDFRFGSGNALAGRYQYSRNNALNASVLGGSLEPLTNRAFSNNGTEWDSIQTVGGQLTSVLRPSLLNDVRAQYSYEHRRRIPNARNPLVSAASIGSIGTPPLLPARLRDSRLQFADGLTLLSGRHALKVGFDYSYISFYQWYGDNQMGAFVISDADVQGVLRTLSPRPGVGNRFDDPSVIFRRQVGVLAVQDEAHQLAFFVQDSWRLRPGLTLNAGVRWEGQLNPKPKTDNEFLVNNVRNFPFPLGRVDPTEMRNNLQQWAPRLGFAWNPQGSRTVIRAQGGLFYAQIPFILYAAPLDSFSTKPSDLSIEIAPGANGTVYDQFLAAGFDLNQKSLGELSVFSVPDIWMKVAGQPDPFAKANVVTTSGKHFRNPRSAQFSFGIQNQLARGLVVDYQLNYVNTVHLTRNIDFNVPRPFIRAGDVSERPFFGLRSGTERPNPNLGQVLVRDSSAKGRYTGHSFRLQLERSRVTVAANYTLGYNKSDDDSERAIAGITYQNPFDLRREYNWSTLDVRHMFDGYALYEAPWGLDFTSLFRYRSGMPIDATTGADTSELLSGALGNRPLNRPGETFFRNSFRNRGYKTVDVRVLKSLPLSETVRIQLSAEVFNVLNFDNVGFVPATLMPDNPAFHYGLGILPSGQVAPVNPGFMSLKTPAGGYNPITTAQQGTPLQAQLGLRFIF
jgi:hypothetical protein